MKFYKGMIPWNKGKKLSEDHKRKVGLASIGRIPPNKGTGIKIEKECLTCLKHFVIGSGGKNRKYCCHKCCPSPMKGKKMSEKTKEKIRLNRKNKNIGELNPIWKGDSVGYFSLHKWVNRHLGKPCECVYCGKTNNEGKLHWASTSHMAKRDLKDYIPLCVKCHKEYDMKGGDIYVSNNNY